MQEQIDRIEKKVDKIADSLTGNEFTNNKGMIDEVQKNSKFRKNSGWINGLFLGFGFGIKAFWEWLKS